MTLSDERVTACGCVLTNGFAVGAGSRAKDPPRDLPACAQEGVPRRGTSFTNGSAVAAGLPPTRQDAHR
jgi:hypothetical protein